MKPEAVRDIIDILPRGRTLFYYFKDRYALLLLERAIGNGLSIAKLRETPFAKLLQRPLLKKIIAHKGAGHLSKDDLVNAWPPNPECYRLTLSNWGADTKSQWERHYHQTTRPGHNLVLQLNFSTGHDIRYRKLLDPEGAMPFAFSDHPIAGKGKITLAWARIDLDFDTGEALIEEIQTDWIRFANLARKRAMEIIESGEARFFVLGNAEVSPKAMLAYSEEVLADHEKIWNEAMLSAALWFLAQEIGITKIFYHEFTCGQILKNVVGSPPRSLYTDLPRKFCFHLGTDAPQFLMAKPTGKLNRLMKKDQLKFWQLEI